MTTSAWSITHYQLDNIKDDWAFEVPARVIDNLISLAARNGHKISMENYKPLTDEQIDERRRLVKAKNQPISVREGKRRPVLELETFTKTSNRENYRGKLHYLLHELEKVLHFIH